MTDVGDAVTLTFQTTAGATVTAEAYDGDGNLVTAATPVTESPAGSWPFTFIGTSAGQWRVVFRSANPTEVERYFVTFDALDRPAPFATVDEYEDENALAPTTGAKRRQIAAKLTSASALMRSRMPADFVPDPDGARSIACTMVHRAIANPGGLRARTVGAYSETLDQNGGLYITDAEVAQLLGQGSPDDPTPSAYTVPLADHGLCWAPVPTWPPHW